MGDIIPITRTSFDLRIASRHLDEASRGVRANTALFCETQQYLRSAENHGLQALAHLDRCKELLDWTDWFCNRCLAATDLRDIEEMVRQRDELEQAWKQQEAIKQPSECLRSAAAR